MSALDSQKDLKASLDEIETKKAAEATSQRPKGADLKLKAKQEKAARRAREKADRASNAIAPSKDNLNSKPQSQNKNKNAVDGSNGPSKHNSPSSNIPQSQPYISIFKHLEIKRRLNSQQIPRDIHPAIVKLGLQFSSFTTIGSKKRGVQFIKCLCTIVDDFQTPTGTTFSRSFMTFLNSQIAFLISCRPLSVAIGNIIRFIKLRISLLEPSWSDEECKKELIAQVQSFHRERIEAAQSIIVQLATQKIIDHDIILVFGYSSLVEETICQASREGKQFKVIIADSHPFFEGRKLMKRLAALEIPTTYLLLSGLHYAISDATKIMFGASAIFSNGSVYTRAGTAIVALAGKEKMIPTMVLCESYKFSERIQFDSIAFNELAPTEQSSPDQSFKSYGLLYDVVPSKLINMCVSELGCIPSSIVPTIINEWKRAELAVTKA